MLKAENFITKKDEETAKKFVEWFEKTDMKKIFFYPAIKSLVLIVLYSLCALMLRQYNFGYWCIFALGLVFCFFSSFAHLPLLGAMMLYFKIDYFIRSKKTVDQILDDLLKIKDVDSETRFSFAKIKYSLGLLDEAQVLLKELMSKDTLGPECRSLLVEIDQQRELIKRYGTKSCSCFS